MIMSASPQPARRTGRGRVLKLIGLNLAIFAAVLGAIELYLRATHPYIIMDVEAINKRAEATGDERRFFVSYTINGRRLVPNTRSRVMNHPLSGLDVELRVNSLGFRGPELPPPAADQSRVLVLGDSIALAPYLPEDQIWVTRLQSELAALVPGNNVITINSGVVDVGIKEELDILEESGLQARPNLVLVEFYLNDLRPPYGFPGEKQRPGWLRRHSVFVQYLYEKFELRKFIKAKGIPRETMSHYLKKDQWKTDHDEFLRVAGKARMDWGSAWEEEPWSVADREFERLARLRDRYGFTVAVAAFPVYFQVYSDFLDDHPQQVLAQKAAAHHFLFLDLLPAFRAHRDQALFYDQCHLQPPANNLVAAELARFLAPELIKSSPLPASTP
jgi:hypothetical protein